MRSRLAAARAAAALLAAAAAAAAAARPFGGAAERGAGAQEAALRTGWDGFVDPSRIDVISNGPITRAYVYRSLLSAEECDHIIEMSEKRLTRSGVVDTKSGHSAVSEIRTSSGTFLGRHQDSVVKSVEERLAEWSQVPETHGEGLQILRYEHGQKYDAHFDYFFHDGGIASGGNRLATALIYLSDVEEGGETVFPNGPKEGLDPTGWSPCAQQGPAVKPRKGDVLLFWSLASNGALDNGSLHGGCPVLAGVKWSATKWMHVAPFSEGKVVHNVWELPTVTKRGDCSPDAAVGACCEDHNKECAHWAASGECEKNPGYMVGNDNDGVCLLSCHKCDDLPIAGWSSD